MTKKQAVLNVELDTESSIEPIAHSMLGAGVSKPVTLHALSQAARELLESYADDRNIRVDALDIRAVLIAEKAIASQSLSILRA